MDAAITRRIAVAAACLLLGYGFTTGPARADTVGVISTFATPTADSAPQGIAAGPDGALWFTESRGNAVGRVNPAGEMTEYPIPTSASWPQGITTGPDGNIWFTEGHAGKIGRITPSGVITEFPLSEPMKGAAAITAGPDGNLWYTRNGGMSAILPGAIGKITPTGTITEYPLPTALPMGIAVGPDGNLWFVTLNSPSLGKITTNGDVSLYPVADAVRLNGGIAAGPDGKLWFTAITTTGGAVFSSTTSGAMSGYALYTGGSVSGPDGVAAGPDGNMWVGVNYPTQITRVTTAGATTDFALAPGAFPYRITAGPDNAMWFTLFQANGIGRITTGLGADAPTVTNVSPATGPSTGGTLITIIGSGFMAATTAKVGGGICSTPTIVTPTTMTCTTPPHSAGTSNVTVRNPDGQAGTLKDGFTYVATAAPSVTGVDPATGPASGGTPITISGGGFVALTTARLGGLPCLTTLVTSPTALTCTTPPNRPGPVDVTAVNPDGQVASLSSAFTYVEDSGPGPSSPPPVDPSPPQVPTPLVVRFTHTSMTVKARGILKANFTASAAAPLTATLRGKKTVRTAVTSVAGANRLIWKLPKKVRPGRYKLTLSHGISVVAGMGVKVKK